MLSKCFGLLFRLYVKKRQKWLILFMELLSQILKLKQKIKLSKSLSIKSSQMVESLLSETLLLCVCDYKG